MKFAEHLDQIVGSRDRVAVGPQRPLTDDEISQFEAGVYGRRLEEHELKLLGALHMLTQYALAHLELGLEVIGARLEQSEYHRFTNDALDFRFPAIDNPITVDSRLEWAEDRHQRLLDTHPASIAARTSSSELS